MNPASLLEPSKPFWTLDNLKTILVLNVFQDKSENMWTVLIHLKGPIKGFFLRNLCVLLGSRAVFYKYNVFNRKQSFVWFLAAKPCRIIRELHQKLMSKSEIRNLMKSRNSDMSMRTKNSKWGRNPPEKHGLSFFENQKLRVQRFEKKISIKAKSNLYHSALSNSLVLATKKNSQ